MPRVPWEALRVPQALVFEFLGVFSRYEYALKATGFVREGRGGQAEPSWHRYCEQHGEALLADDEPEFSAAVRYLLDFPPQRQTHTPGEGLGWGAVLVPADANECRRVVEYVRCVRNNLFHGGKFVAAIPGEADDRNEKLLRASLAVLSTFLRRDEARREAFES